MSGKAVNIEFIIQLCISMGDLCMSAWFGLVKKHAVDVLLGTWFIDPCLPGMVPTKRKIVPCPLAIEARGDYFYKDSDFRSMRIILYSLCIRAHIMTLQATNLNSCRVEDQITLPAYAQSAALKSSQDAGLVTIETTCSIAERWHFMTARGPMDTLLDKRIYVYILTMTWKPVNLPRFMIVAQALRATACIMYSRNDDEPYILRNEDHILTHLNDGSTFTTVNVLCFQLQEPHNEQVDHQKAVKTIRQKFPGEWKKRKELAILNRYSLFGNKITRMFKQFESMWNGPFSSVTAAQHRMEVNKTDSLPIRSTPYRAGQKAGELKNKKSVECSPWTLLNPHQRSRPHPSSLYSRRKELFAFALTMKHWTQWQSVTCTRYRAWKNVSICFATRR